MRANQKALAVFMLTILCCGFAVAQETTKKMQPAKTPGARSTEQAAIAVPLPKASPEMVKLHRMAGAWKTTQKFETSALMSRGGTSRGTADIKVGPGGLSLFLEFRAPGIPGAAGGGACIGHSIIYGDPAEQGLRDLWCDAATAGGCSSDKVGLGKWEGDKLVFHGEQDVQGKKMKTRTTFSFPARSSMIITMEGATEGGEMKPLMTVNFGK